jgi:hypothetical protein
VGGGKDDLLAATLSREGDSLFDSLTVTHHDTVCPSRRSCNTERDSIEGRCAAERRATAHVLQFMSRVATQRWILFSEIEVNAVATGDCVIDYALVRLIN